MIRVGSTFTPRPSSSKRPDNATLTTGGAIAGSGTSSSASFNITNAVSIGQGDQFTTDGLTSIGTYLWATATTNAYSDTYGGIALGSASADTEFTANQTVTLANNVDITSFENAYLTAGEDEADGGDTRITLSAVAQAYVDGFITVPVVSATANATSHATLVIGSNDSIRSGENITAGAYEGTPTVTTDGTGHASELGFIPVTAHGNSSSVTTSSDVTIDGALDGGHLQHAARHGQRLSE